jgi:hypothetical protein
MKHLERYLAAAMMFRGLWLLVLTRQTDLSPALLRAMSPLSPEGWGSLYLLVGLASLIASAAQGYRSQLAASSAMIVVLSYVTWSLIGQAPRSLLIPNSVGQIAGAMVVVMLHLKEGPP